MSTAQLVDKLSSSRELVFKWRAIGDELERALEANTRIGELAALMERIRNTLNTRRDYTPPTEDDVRPGRRRAGLRGSTYEEGA